jgi:hypothetical protein
MLAAWRFNSGEAAGLVGALRALQQQAYGSLLLGLIALGLLSYGFFEILQVFARRVDAEGATTGGESRLRAHVNLRTAMVAAGKPVACPR